VIGRVGVDPAAEVGHTVGEHEAARGRSVLQGETPLDDLEWHVDPSSTRRHWIGDASETVQPPAADGHGSHRRYVCPMNDVAQRWQIRSTELGTKRDIARVFVSQSSPRIIMTTTVLVLAIRLPLASWGMGDLYVVGFTVAFTGVLEWVLHLFVLHASPDSFVTRRLGGGVNHRKHHLDPPDMRWLLLDGFDAALFLTLLAVLTGLWSVPLLMVTGSSVTTGYLTALSLTYLAFWNYEWTHLMVHTRYRPRTRFYARLERNHRLHHYRNERYWLGVTSNLGDRIMGSYPKSKTDVALSETARTLDR
jgi:hypothetical protein